MALQVWLPLNGNLNNQGVSDATFSTYANSTGLAINASGKLGGQCYERTAAAANGYRSNKTFLMDKDVSMCCWAYVSSTPGNSANGLITNHNHVDGSGFGITVHQLSTTDYRISCSEGRTGNDRTYCTHYGTSNIKDAWHHLGLTYQRDSGTLKLYVDGICEKTLTGKTTSVGSNPFDLFNWSTGHIANASYRPVCKLNDIRLYDHCLSGKEMSEVAKGLVVHYPLDNNGQGGVNLLTNGNTSTTNNSYGMVTLTPNPIMVAGETYTLTLCVTPAANVTHYCPYVSSGYKNLGNYTVSGTDKQFITKTFTCGYASGREPSVSAANANIVFYRFPNDGTVTTSSTFHWAKLEKGSGETVAYWSPHYSATDFDKTIYDCSGYGYHGSIAGTCYTEKNSPRYSEATTFDGSTTYITTPLKPVLTNLFQNKCTFNFWCKEGSTSSRSIYFGGYDGNTGFNIEENGGAFRVYWAGSPNLQKGTVTAGEWAMWTVVINKATGIKVYKNGVEINTHNSALTTNVPVNINPYIGRDARAASDGVWHEGTMSDFRIYATALSESDIKEMYNTPISIGKTGAAMAYNFKEV